MLVAALPAESGLTMGVSSRHSCANSVRSSARIAAGARGYADAKVPQADTRDVNHSPVANRCGAASQHRRQCQAPLARMPQQDRQHSNCQP